MSEPEERFLLYCRVAKVRLPVREFRFAPPRRWRFDFAWEDALVAVEIDGGMWTGGRHTRGKGFAADLEKMNEATIAGWRVIRLTPEMVTMKWVERVAALVLRYEAQHDGL